MLMSNKVFCMSSGSALVAISLEINKIKWNWTYMYSWLILGFRIQLGMWLMDVFNKNWNM